MLFLCKFTDYALNLEITENNSIGDNIYAMSPFNRIYSSFDIGEKNIYNNDKICLSKIFISKTEIKGGKQR